MIDGHCAQWKGTSGLLASRRWPGWVPALCGAARGEEGRGPLGPEGQGGWEREPWLACPQTLSTLEEPSHGLPASEPLEGRGGVKPEVLRGARRRGQGWCSPRGVFAGSPGTEGG